MEKDSTRGSRAKADRKKARTRRVKFPDTITLLEAASRNDVEEGGWSGRHMHKKNKRTDGDTHTHAYIHTQTYRQKENTHFERRAVNKWYLTPSHI
jgi:hypothetical protein